MKAILQRVVDIFVGLLWSFRSMGPGVKAVLLLCLGGFVIQRTVDANLIALINAWVDVPRWVLKIVVMGQRQELCMALFGLSAEGLRSNFWWQLMTYMFLHGSVWHLLMNALMIVMFGPQLEERVGARRFLRIFLVCGICGGMGWLLLGELWSVNVCVGASGGVFGLIGAFCGMYPARMLALYGFIDMRARTLALLLAGALFLNVLLGSGGSVADSAHLVGGIVGYLSGMSIRIGGGLRLRLLKKLRRGRKPKLRLIKDE